jgi:hypothetical protein
MRQLKITQSITPCSRKAIYKRFTASGGFTTKWMNFMRAILPEGYGRIRFFKTVRKLLLAERSFRAYFEGEISRLPPFYKNFIPKDPGTWWQWLPEGAPEHDANAYLHKNPRQKAAEGKNYRVNQWGHPFAGRCLPGIALARLLPFRGTPSRPAFETGAFLFPSVNTSEYVIY